MKIFNPTNKTTLCLTALVVGLTATLGASQAAMTTQQSSSSATTATPPAATSQAGLTIAAEEQALIKATANIEKNRPRSRGCLALILGWINPLAWGQNRTASSTTATIIEKPSPASTHENAMLKAIEAKGFAHQAALAKMLYEQLQSMPLDLIIIISDYAKGIEGVCMHTFKDHKGSIDRLDFIQRSHYPELTAFSQSDRNSSYWILDSNRFGFTSKTSGEKDYCLLRNLPITYKAQSVQLESKSTQQEYLYNPGGTVVEILDQTTGKRLTVLWGPSESETTASTELPDGRLVLSTQARYKLDEESEEAQPTLTIFPTPASRKQHTQATVAILYDIITSLPRELLHIIAEYSATRRQQITGYEHPITALLVLPENKLVSGAVNGEIRIWDLESNECLRIVQEHEAQITALELSPDKTLFASGDSQGVVKLWQ